MASEGQLTEFLDTLTERQVEDLLTFCEHTAKAIREYSERELDHPSNPDYKEYF